MILVGAIFIAYAAADGVMKCGFQERITQTVYMVIVSLRDRFCHEAEAQTDTCDEDEVFIHIIRVYACRPV